MLLLFTDGVSEAMNEDQTEFGEDRLGRIQRQGK
jgi:serine phosphatase RsbU (regulator of sigma subunit)